MASFFTEYFSSHFKETWNKVKHSHDKCLELVKDIETKNKNDITLIFILLTMCNLTEEHDLMRKYCNRANEIYLFYKPEKIDLLSTIDWTELEVYKYDLNTIFKNPLFYIAPNEVEPSEGGRFIFNEGDQVLYRYEILEQIGKGSYSNVYSCMDHKRKHPVALKCIRNNSLYRGSGKREIEILTLINHKNICNYLKYFTINNNTFISFELHKNNLYNELKINKFYPFGYHIVKQIISQCLEALNYIKILNIVHSDLKPENIVIKEYDYETIQIKIIDFGSSLHPKEKYAGYIQSRYYRAPEIILNRGFSHEIDMWSLVCIMYELLIGHPLFPSKNEKELIYDIYKELGYPTEQFFAKCYKKNILNDQVYITDHIDKYNKIQKIKKHSLSAYNFIKSGLKWLPHERITPKEALTHEYILN